MSGVGVVAPILLGAVFLVAGGSKLASGRAWHGQAGDLGTPSFLIPIVPWLELAVGAALVVQLVEPVPALVALVLLVGFTIAIALRLAAGERPVCACFGAWSASPIGTGHLLRNAALMALAVVVLVS